MSVKPNTAWQRFLRGAPLGNGRRTFGFSGARVAKFKAGSVKFGHSHLSRIAPRFDLDADFILRGTSSIFAFCKDIPVRALRYHFRQSEGFIRRTAFAVIVLHYFLQARQKFPEAVLQFTNRIDELEGMIIIQLSPTDFFFLAFQARPKEIYCTLSHEIGQLCRTLRSHQESAWAIGHSLRLVSEHREAFKSGRGADLQQIRKKSADFLCQ